MKPDTKTKLQPVIFVKGKYNYHRQNLLQQNLLLKALQITTNPEELKAMIGVRTVAEVYRTLDKIAIRKEYHEALLRHDMDLDTIVKGIKKICENPSESGKVRLAGWNILLKSMGLDRYEEPPKETRENWEDVVKQTIRELDEPKKLKAAKSADYEVITPEAPADEIERQKEEREIGESLYE